jgi:hypothetical protein
MNLVYSSDRPCGLVVRVPGYRSRGPGFDFRRYQIFWEVVGLEWGPHSLVSTIEELLGRNSSGSGLENREYGHIDPLRWPCDALYSHKLAVISPISGGRAVGIVRLRTKATEFVRVFFVACLRWGGGTHRMLKVIIHRIHVYIIFIHPLWFYTLSITASTKSYDTLFAIWRYCKMKIIPKKIWKAEDWISTA